MKVEGLVFTKYGFQVLLETEQGGGDAMNFYRDRKEAGRPVLQIAMPRLPRLYAPGGTLHVVARCNNREFYFATPEDFGILLDHLGEMSSAYEIILFAYSLMSNHIHLLLQAPTADLIGRPLRWFMTQTAKTFHRLRSRSGHFWERRYRACLKMTYMPLRRSGIWIGIRYEPAS